MVHWTICIIIILIDAHTSGGTAGALASHTILQDMHRFQRSITDRQDKKKALMSIHLKELLKKWQTSLT